MSDIFISYASVDRERAKSFADLLSARGWSVWWDRAIPAGRDFDEVIEEALDAARCVVVLWSKASVASRWVKTESAEAMRKNALIPTLIEDARIPLEFRRLQTPNLSQWVGEPDHPEFLNFLHSVEAHLHGARNPASSASVSDRGVGVAPDAAAPRPAFSPSSAAKSSPVRKNRNLLRNALIALGALVVVVVGVAAFNGQGDSVRQQRAMQEIARNAVDERAAAKEAARETVLRKAESSAAAVARDSVVRGQQSGLAKSDGATLDARPSVVNIGGRWRDATGGIHQIRQSGSQFEMVTANPGNGYTARSRGTINGRQVVTEFQTNLPSTGRANGSVAADGQSISGTVVDSRLGQYGLTLYR